MNIPIDRRALPGSIVLGALTISFFIFLKPLSLVSLFVFCFHLSFFRNPRRIPPPGEFPVSPADGTVVAIDTVQENRFLNSEVYKIGIFLSIFNAHVNRSPISGEICYWNYQKGKFLNALQSDSAEFNECLWLGIEGAKRKILVRLIAGAIARRICCEVSKGDQLQRGVKIGIICYGSRAEVYIPKNNFRLSVKIGDKVKAGLTILGEWIQ